MGLLGATGAWWAGSCVGVGRDVTCVLTCLLGIASLGNRVLNCEVWVAVSKDAFSMSGFGFKAALYVV